MPSVGAILVGRRKSFNSEVFTLRVWLGAARFTAQFRVAARLVTVKTGLTPAGNSAAIMFPMVSQVPPSPLKVFLIVL
jgi:hypothetical protein